MGLHSCDVQTRQRQQMMRQHRTCCTRDWRDRRECARSLPGRQYAKLRVTRVLGAPPMSCRRNTAKPTCTWGQ